MSDNMKEINGLMESLTVEQLHEVAIHAVRLIDKLTVRKEHLMQEELLHATEWGANDFRHDGFRVWRRYRVAEHKCSEALVGFIKPYVDVRGETRFETRTLHRNTFLNTDEVVRGSYATFQSAKDNVDALLREDGWKLP